jgi:hypothetical protein
MELLTFIWDYDNRTVNLSMPEYVQAAALHKFQHTMPNCQQDVWYKINPPQYGTKVQLTDEPDNMPCLSPKEVKHIQEVVSTFLCHSQAHQRPENVKVRLLCHTFQHFCLHFVTRV